MIQKTTRCRLWIAAICMMTSFARSAEKRLVLAGAVLSGDGISSTAIIKWESPARDEIVRVGDRLGNYLVAGILSDRVEPGRKAADRRIILLGQPEKIESDGDPPSGEGRRGRGEIKPSKSDHLEAAFILPPVPVIEKEFPKEALQTKLVAEWPRLLREGRWTPYYSGGALAGIKIVQLPDLKGFPDFGLRENDIVTSVNDVRLNDPSAVLVLQEMARTQKTFDVLLERDGKPVRIRYVLKDSPEK